MKSSSIIAIGGGIAAAIIIGIALTMSGVSDSQDLSENYMGETIDSSESLQENKIHVLASFYPYYEFTRNVAGDSATVLQYMPSGIEAHDWEPRPQEIQSLKDADVFVYNGLGMEPYVENMIDSGEFDNVMFVKVSEGVELIKPDEGHDAHAEDFAKEIEHVIEEFEEGHIDSTQALASIEEILHEHEGDGHAHGNETIEKIEAVIHEIEEGHVSAEDGIEEIHHIVLDKEEEHGSDEGHDAHAEDFAKEIEHVIEEFEEGHIDSTQALASIEEILHEHEGDGHAHGNETIEKIEAVIHEIEEGHVSAEDGIEEIHHIVLDKEEGHDAHEEEGHDGHAHDFEFDPHIWLDPILVKQQVNNIRDALIEADPKNKERYEQNAMAYNEKLNTLDMKIKSSLKSCSKDTFVPFHNAFTYLGERYDLKVMALGGLAPDSEATAAEIAEFVDFVKDNEIKVIFAEELVDPRLAEVIADEAGAEVLLFSPIEALLPEEVGTGVTYIDKMEQNLNSLKMALECQ